MRTCKSTVLPPALPAPKTLKSVITASFTARELIGTVLKQFMNLYVKKTGQISANSSGLKSWRA